MGTKSINISETLYQGLSCAKKAFDANFSVEDLVNVAIVEFLINRANFYKTQAAGLENYVNVWESEKQDGKL